MHTDRQAPAAFPLPARLGLLAVLCASLGGCAYDAEKLQAFLQQPPDRVVSGDEYRVYPPDVITITSLHVPEISGQTARMRPDGYINLPLLGELYIAGKTCNEIEEQLMEASRSYYEQVDATVNVAGYNSQNYYVLGQVSGAGPKAWTGRDTLLGALARAQPTPLAWPERIILIRGDQPQEGGHMPDDGDSLKYKFKGIDPESEDNVRHKMVINLQAMVEHGDTSNNILLKPNDIIYVQPNPFAKVGLALQNLLFPVRPAFQTVGLPSAATAAAGAP